jgi:phosphoesterase RecJ-like protein
LIIIIDTNSYSQLPKLEQYLKQTDKPVLVIDHHVTADSLGTVELVEPEAAATALIVHDLLKYAKWPETKKITQALFLAVATDTGWFHFSNTDNRVFRTCAELIAAGANPTAFYHDLYQNFSPQRFRLMATMLNTLELHFEGRFAAQYLRQGDFERTGASYEDTEDLINECQRISTVEVAALFVELKDGRIKCSLRSKGTVDVCEIAQKFGGGGHRMAAGAYLPGPLENATHLITEEVKKQL